MFDKDYHAYDTVAPFVGAWIEISVCSDVWGVERSLRSSERGLKLSNTSLIAKHADVAPFVGAWIEIEI